MSIPPVFGDRLIALFDIIADDADPARRIGSVIQLLAECNALAHAAMSRDVKEMRASGMTIPVISDTTGLAVSQIATLSSIKNPSLRHVISDAIDYAEIIGAAVNLSDT